MQKMLKSLKNIFIIFLISFSLSPVLVSGATIQSDKEEILKAKVLEIMSSGKTVLPGLDEESDSQRIRARIYEEDGTENDVIFENDYLQLEEGEKFYARKITRYDSGKIIYAVSDVNRMPYIIFFTALFVVLTVIFGGWQGIRGLLSLIGGLLLIFFILIPEIVAGSSPFLVSSVVASLIIVVGSYVTHGFNRTTSSAVLGMIVTVLITGVLAYIAVHVASLSGMDSDEATYLALNTRGTLNLQGLLLSGIIIGLLGVLYDSAIGQAVSVEELWRADPKLSKSYVFARSLRIGREHIGALVNTLAIAYVGVALPLLVLFSFPNFGSSISLINREMFASEIIRTLIGSIGLILAIPITTFISVWMLHGRTFKGQTGHSHSHGHSH